jgi:hypothetical protein
MPVLAPPRPRPPVTAASALDRVAAKQRVVEQVIAGRLGLVAAAARFAALGRGLLPAAEDGEGVCRAVIGWAELALRDCPERAAAVAERLESELRRHLNRHGGVDLPRPA